MRPWYYKGRMVSVLLVACMIGCSGVEPVETQQLRSNMRGLAIAYGRFMSKHRGRPPKSEQQLRDFVDSLGADFLQLADVESVDDMFISSRDGKPYVVLYGKRAEIVAYEQEGVDGKRFVATSVGSTEEMDEDRFRQAVPDAE